MSAMAAHTIPVLQKSIAVLKLIAEGRGNTTAKALEQTLGIPHSTMYRILQTLVGHDWVRQVESGQFELSFGLLPLLQPLVRHELLIEITREPLLALGRTTGLTTKLSVLQGSFAITLFRTESPRATSVHVKIGSAFHVALGSSGAVLLSGLAPAARQRIIDNAPEECWRLQTPADVDRRLAELARTGACVDPGSYRLTVFAISAPLRDRGGDVVAAITAIGFPEDFEGARLKANRRAVIETAARCCEQLQGGLVEGAPVAG
jgi:DNA-binding IclR family transcriptional regulator